MNKVVWIIIAIVVAFLLYLIYIINFGTNLIKPCAYLQRGYKNIETGKCENFSTCGYIPTNYIKDPSCGVSE